MFKVWQCCQLELSYELPIKKLMAVLIMPSINELTAIPGVSQRSFQGYISKIPYHIAYHLGKCDIQSHANSQSGGWADRGIQVYILWGAQSVCTLVGIILCLAETFLCLDALFVTDNNSFHLLRPCYIRQYSTHFINVANSPVFCTSEVKWISLICVKD